MANEAGLIDFYNYVYQPFSAAAHSMWHHVGKFNLRHCLNPLHRYHRVPEAIPQNPDIFFLQLAGKYLARAFDIFDQKTNTPPPEHSAVERLYEEIESLDNEMVQQPKNDRPAEGEA